MNTRPCGSTGAATGAATGAVTGVFTGAGFAGGSPQAATIKTRIDRYARMVAATLPQPTGLAATLDSRPHPAIPLGMRRTPQPRVSLLTRAALLAALTAVACPKDEGQPTTTTTGSTGGDSSGDPTSTGSTGTPTTTGVTTIETIGDVSTTMLGSSGDTGTSSSTSSTGTGTTGIETGTTAASTGDTDTDTDSSSTTSGGGLGEGEICQDQPNACAPGLLCCYPCGIPDCMNKCIKADPQTMMCPLFP